MFLEMVLLMGRMLPGSVPDRLDVLREPPCALVIAQERMRSIYDESGEVSFIEWVICSRCKDVRHWGRLKRREIEWK